MREAKQMVEEGKRELEVLVRRREDINAEISRVQDVLEALESFEAPPGGKDNGVKAGATVGAPVRVASPRKARAPVGRATWAESGPWLRGGDGVLPSERRPERQSVPVPCGGFDQVLASPPAA